MFPSGSHWPGPGLSSLPGTEQGELRGHSGHSLSPGGTQNPTWQDGAAPGAVAHDGTHHHGVQTVAPWHCHSGPSHSCPVLPCPGGAIHTSSSRRRCSSSWLVPVSPSPAGLPAPGASATLSDIAAGGTRITSGSLPAPGPGTRPEAPAGPAWPSPLLPGFGCPQPRPCAASPAGESWAEEGDGAPKDPKARVLTPPAPRATGTPPAARILPGGTGEAARPRDEQHDRDPEQQQHPGAPGRAAPPGPAPASAPQRPRDRDRHRHRLTRMHRTTGPESAPAPARRAVQPPGYRDMQPPHC